MSNIHRPVSTRFIWRLLLIMLVIPGVINASEESFSRVLKTKYSLIRFQNVEDLEQLSEKLEFGPESGWSLRKALFGYKENELLTETSSKVDAIYRRAQALLGMNRRLKPVTIQLYSNRKQLASAYHKLFGEPCKERAWYIFEKNTIYINTNDVHDGMLAHEMAHSIIDHYLMMKPPTATAEILAKYVDRHLKNSGIKLVDDEPKRAAYPSN